MKFEEGWLKELIKKNKNSVNIAIVTEVNGRISGIAELRRYSGRKIILYKR